MAAPECTVADSAETLPGFRRCDYCPPDDHEWPVSEFSACGTAYSGAICNACFEERHPARYANCSGCGRYMRTRKREGAPTCRRCRRGESAIRCGECSRAPSGQRMHETPDGPRCSGCYQARRRAA